jgi:cytochrome b involved in lipid metabolism
MIALTVVVFLVGCSIHTRAFVSPSVGLTKQPMTRHARLHSVVRDGNSNTDTSSKRLERTATDIAEVDEPCILTIEGVRYNVTAWARAHPGGVNILKKFHGKDATKAFHAADHSKKAYEMLEQFAIQDPTTTPAINNTVIDFTAENSVRMLETTSPAIPLERKKPRWMQKLFTKEDPIGLHKTMGIFVLLHFLFRFGQMYFFDPSAGFGTRMGKGPGIIAPLCLIPHALLSLSSLIFHTVPRERVVGQPMIWQEFRMHNIIFGLRSVIAAFLGYLTIYNGNTRAWRRFAVSACCVNALVANIVADEATRRLREDTSESTTATMPYWEGCSVETQKKFKTFYAYCQFLATGACITVGNPAWPLAVLIAIQLASLLMTLVRKGLLSARGYHIGYTISLIMPYFAGLRSMFYSKSLEFPVLLGIGWMLFQLRRQGVSKYALWIPVYAFRIAYGDHFINWQAW